MPTELAIHPCAGEAEEERNKQLTHTNHRFGYHCPVLAYVHVNTRFASINVKRGPLSLAHSEVQKMRLITQTQII